MANRRPTLPVRTLADYAKGLGFRCEFTGGGHLKFVHDSGAIVYAATTPSCPRSEVNTRARLRRIARWAGEQ